MVTIPGLDSYVLPLFSRTIMFLYCLFNIKLLYEKINLNFYLHFMFLLSVPHKIYNKTCDVKFYFKICNKIRF